MAANVSDAVHSAMQQVLIQAVKEGVSPEEITPAIFRALIDRGFTTFAALELEVIDAELLGKVRQELRLPESRDIAHYLNTLTRTNLFESINEARFAYFTDPKLEGYVRAFEYSAVLDDRTTELCLSLNGTIFAADSPEWMTYQPPNHYQLPQHVDPDHRERRVERHRESGLHQPTHHQFGNG